MSNTLCILGVCQINNIRRWCFIYVVCTINYAVRHLMSLIKEQKMELNKEKAVTMSLIVFPRETHEVSSQSTPVDTGGSIISTDSSNLSKVQVCSLTL